VERTTLEQVKNWVQHRIDYWENICEKHKYEPSCVSEQVIFEEGIMIGEEKGMLAAFYMVIECINGQRR
jgi:hypothetical protein